MHYLVIAHDFKDPECPSRRLAKREEHLRLVEEMYSSGILLYGGALLNEEKQMIGSAEVVNFDIETQLQEWLHTEPYVTGKVWDKISITPYLVGPLFV